MTGIQGLQPLCPGETSTHTGHREKMELVWSLAPKLFIQTGLRPGRREGGDGRGGGEREKEEERETRETAGKKDGRGKRLKSLRRSLVWFHPQRVLFYLRESVADLSGGEASVCLCERKITQKLHDTAMRGWGSLQFTTDLHQGAELVFFLLFFKFVFFTFSSFSQEIIGSWWNK